MVKVKSKGRQMPHRQVIVGLDGMPYGLMQRYAQDGTMPNLGRLAKEGVFRPMASSIPEISSVAWSSIITGANPGEHGVFGFTDIAPGTYRRIFPNFDHLAVKPFWERKGSGRSVIINVPTTFPAHEMNGVHIAGFVALDLERATYPTSLVPTLQEMDYRVDVDSSKAHETLGFFLQDLNKTLKARIAVYRYLWNQQDWDTFMLVFTGTDRLAHFLWDACQDETEAYHQELLAHFGQIDEVIGEIAADLCGDDLLVVLSDHGFERLEKDVYVNYVLREAGFLSFQNESSPTLKAVSENTKAFALDPGRIYINLEGRYPRGSVKLSARESVVAELTALFESLEIEGKRAIKRAYRREELYHGPHMNQAPDLVLLGNQGYNLRGSWKAKQAFGQDRFAGKHSQGNAFLLVWGGRAKQIVPDCPSVFDVVNVIDGMQQ